MILKNSINFFLNIEIFEIHKLINEYINCALLHYLAIKYILHQIMKYYINEILWIIIEV